MTQGRIRLSGTDNQHQVTDVIERRACEEIPPVESGSDTYWDAALGKFLPIFDEVAHG